MDDSSQGLDTLTLEQLCSLARDGRQAERLEDYLSADTFRELDQVLKRPARAMGRAPKGTVVLLHGILGSQIGKLRRSEWDIVWLNPFAIRDGNMSRLRLGTGTSGYGARGLMPLFYSLLWARLKYWYGYNLVEFAYDWRQSIDSSASALAEFVDQLAPGPVSLVAHSMGGLVARAALPQTGSRVQRVIQLATPNYGSFQPVLTLRAQNEFINKILACDNNTTPTEVISTVVSTFQGLYEMLPSPARFTGVNLFDPSVWPASPSVNATVLARAKSGIEALPPPDDRIVLIAGRNQETVTDMSRDSTSGEFRFTTTTSGDGTVPLSFARFDEAAKIPTYLADVTHNGIVLDGEVAAAIDDLLRTGKTTRLAPDNRTPSRSGESPKPLDVSKAANPFRGRRGDELSLNEIRQAQREVLGPLQPSRSGIPDGRSGRIPEEMSGGGGGAEHGFKGVVVSRRRRRLRLLLAHGDITQVPAHAHVLGAFAGVTPSGPAAAYDDLLDGAVSDLFARRMFSGDLGRIYMLPMYKTPVPGELLVFAGLGRVEEFQPGVAEDVARQVLQSLLRVRVTELATVVFGGSFDDVRNYLPSLLRGFIAGMQEVDDSFEFSRLIICERDAEKYRRLQQELYSLASSPLFDDVEVEFDEINVHTMATARRSQSAAPLRSGNEQSLYLLSNLVVDTADVDADTNYRHELSVLPPATGTTFARFVKDFSKSELDQVLRVVQNGAPSDMEAFSERLSRLILPDDLPAQYQELLNQHSVQLLHDALSSRIPWESVKFGDIYPATTQGLCRKYQRTNRNVSMFSSVQRSRDQLNVLLVYNPTQDLEGAEQEGERIRSLMVQHSDRLSIKSLKGPDATRSAILDRLKQESFDVLHYAGHAAFVAENPSQSGLLCADHEILSGRELEPLSTKLPPVIILNACESGRVRRRRERDNTTSAPASAAEAILNAGIMCFLATYWPVSDAGADIFAKVFYEQLLLGMEKNEEPRSMGQAVLTARKALMEAGQEDWANYMLYGNPDFIPKGP